MRALDRRVLTAVIVLDRRVFAAVIVLARTVPAGMVWSACIEIRIIVV